MLIVFVAGIDQTDPFGGCVAVSALIQYFTLVSVMWMGAEAVLMFQKLVIVFVQITTKYIVIVSLICWRKCNNVSPYSFNYCLWLHTCYADSLPHSGSSGTSCDSPGDWSRLYGHFQDFRDNWLVSTATPSSSSTSSSNYILPGKSTNNSSCTQRIINTLHTLWFLSTAPK